MIPTPADARANRRERGVRKGQGVDDVRNSRGVDDTRNDRGAPDPMSNRGEGDVRGQQCEKTPVSYAKPATLPKVALSNAADNEKGEARAAGVEEPEESAQKIQEYINRHQLCTCLSDRDWHFPQVCLNATAVLSNFMVVLKSLSYSSAWRGSNFFEDTT